MLVESLKNADSKLFISYDEDIMNKEVVDFKVYVGSRNCFFLEKTSGTLHGPCYLVAVLASKVDLILYKTRSKRKVVWVARRCGNPSFIKYGGDWRSALNQVEDEICHCNKHESPHWGACEKVTHVHIGFRG